MLFYEFLFFPEEELFHKEIIIHQDLQIGKLVFQE